MKTRSRTNNYLRIGPGTIVFFDDRDPDAVDAIKERVTKIPPHATTAIYNDVPGVNVRRVASVMVKCTDRNCATRESFAIESVPDSSWFCRGHSGAGASA